MSTNDNARENWGSKIGLIFAMAGNAIGLGNFWRFPYQAASNGGGAFMIPYFIAIIVLGIPVMLVEWNLGRYGGKYGHGTLGPMVYLQAREGTKPKNAAIIGALAGSLAFGVTLLVNSYYNHIIGWALGYSYLSVTGGYMGNISSGEVFSNYIQNPAMVFTFWIIILASLGYTVMKGVQKGIETWAKIMMPVLYVFGIVLSVKALTIGSPVNPDWSSLKGLNFIWNPDFSTFSWRSSIAAAGQVFFTLSIGMGIICNYASYLKPDDDVVVSSFATISLNEFAEVILGGTAVIPIAYAFMGPDGLGQGVGLAFVALPNVFNSMAGGQIFGTLWFLLIVFAGFTSAIAMYNYLVDLLEEDMGIQRNKGVWIIFAAYVFVGLPVGLEGILTHSAKLVYLTEVDNWIGTYLLIVLGLIEIVVVAWLMKDKALVEINKGGIWQIPKWYFNLFHKTLTPILTSLLLIFATIDKAKAGHFNIIPGYVASTPELVPWVNGGRIVVLLVLIAGFIQSYKSISSRYGKELDENEISIRVG